MSVSLSRRTVQRNTARLLCSSALAPLLVGFASSAFAQAVNLGYAAQNSIVPDGRTATSVTVNGNVTDIRTSTFRGGNAYNSFSTFSEAAGNTVNLFVPKKAANLVNIVRNGAVDIEGTLNAFQNGKIGGNVVFADSYGMIVGKSGTINVGGLTVVTPSGATLNSLVDSNGHVNECLAAATIAGNVPLSPDGSVVIKGKINAQNFVTITAHDVKVAGSYDEAMRSATQRAQFEATVNSQGMQEGGAIVAHNGSIEIVAAHDATIGGSLTASGGAVSISAKRNATIKASARATSAIQLAAIAPEALKAAKPPTVSVEAGGTASIAGALSAVAATGGSPGEIRIAAEDISVAATAKLAAIGVGAVDGGHILIKATDTTSVAAGASFAANATGSGNGGLIEISGETDNVATNIAVSLGAVSGKAGTLLFDPDNLIIGGTAQSNLGDDATVSTAGSLHTDGASVELDANNSITIDGVIDTRKYTNDTTAPVAGILTSVNPSTGNSGSITLDAPTITIASGAALYADVYNSSGHSFTGGAVTLTANATNNNPIGLASATSSITINGAITGASIAANATADAEAVYAFDSNNNPPDMARVSGLQIGLDLSPLSLSPGYVQSRGSATVTVGTTGALTASSTSSGNIQLTAHTKANSSDPMVGLSPGGAAFAAGVVVGMTDATAKVEVEDGATVTGGGTLTVAATNDATVAIKAMVVSGFFGLTGAPAVVTVVYGEAEVNSSALIDSGASVSFSGLGSAVDILARNDNFFSAAATSYARNGGAAGVAVAITDFNSSATAHDGASIGTSGSKVGSVTILAQDATASDQTAASSTTGVSALGDVFGAINVLGSAVGQGIEGEGATPPNAGIVSTIFSETAFGKSMQTGSAAMPSSAGALSLALGTQTAAASVSADVNTDSNGNPVSRIVATPPSIYASGSVAIASDVNDAAFLTYASSSVNSPAAGDSISPPVSNAVSDALGYSDITHNSSAVVGPNTTINAFQIGLQATTELPSPIENIDWEDFDSGGNSVLNGLESALDQLLQNKLLANTATNSTSSSMGLSIAGSINIANFNLNTTAWVGDGATLTASSQNSVGTWQTPDLTSLDPKSGVSSGTAQESFTGEVWVYAKSTVETINGAGNAGLSGNTSSGTAAVGASFSYVDDTVNTIAGVAQHASISASGGELYVNALTVEHVVDISPSNGGGSGLNVSGLVDLFFLNDDTSASISKNAYVSAGTVNLGADDDVGVYSISGDFTLGNSSTVGMSVTYIDLSSDTEGYIGDNSNVVSAAIDPSSLDSAVPANFAPSVNAGGVEVYAKTSGNAIAASLVAQVADTTPNPTSPIPGQSASQRLAQLASSTSSVSVSIAAAAASSVIDSAVKTAAYVNGATVTSSALTVEATNDMLVASGSGGAAIVVAGATVNAAGALSGAIAIDSSSNSTLAYIESSTVSASAVNVDAQTGGMTAAVGIGLSVNTSTSSSSGSFAGSVSLAQIDDRVASYIDNSSVSVSGGNTVVLAEQDTKVGIGAGAFFLGGAAGFGVGLTYVDVENPSAGPATDAHISNSSVSGYDIDVIADAPQIVYVAAASGGVSTKLAIGGSLIFDTLDATTSATISNSGTTALAITATDNLGVLASTDLSDLPLAANSVFSSSDSGASEEESFFAGDGSSTATQAGSALLSGSSAAIISIAGIIEVGNGTGVGVSVIVNTVDEQHQASISGVTVSAPNAVVVAATDSTSIMSVAVGFTASLGGYAGEGASVTNTIEGGPSATIGSASSGAGIAATTIGTSSSGGAVGSLTVDANNSSSITGSATTGSFSLNGAAGVALAINDIGTAASAIIQNASVRTTYSSSQSFGTGDIVVESDSSGAILSIAAGVSASAESFGGEGSAASNKEHGTVTSSVASSTLFATNNVGVLAANNNAVDAIAGAVGIGANTAGIGVSITVNQIAGDTDATISSSTVDAEALEQATLQIVDGALNTSGTTQISVAPETPSSPVTPDALPTLGRNVRTDHGVAVVSGSVQTSRVVAVTVGVSTSLAAGVNIVTTTMGGDTEATISGSHLDTNLTSSDSAAAIDVSAHSVSFANNWPSPSPAPSAILRAPPRSSPTR